MNKKVEVCLDMVVVVNELKEALSAQEVKPSTTDEAVGILTEKLVHLFSIREFDLFLLFFKTLVTNHKLILPNVFNPEHCNNELKEPLCAAIVANLLEAV